MIVLFSFSDRPGLKDLTDIQKLYEKISSALKLEIGSNHREDETYLSKLQQLIWVLRNLNNQHIAVLNKFKSSAPDIEFPALHKELFSVDCLENSWGYRIFASFRLFSRNYSGLAVWKTCEFPGKVVSCPENSQFPTLHKELLGLHVLLFIKFMKCMWKTLFLDMISHGSSIRTSLIVYSCVWPHAFMWPFQDLRDINWTASSEFGTYSQCEQQRFRRACASAQSRQNLRCSLIQAVSQEEPSDRKPDPWPLWMSWHAQLKFVMTECSKTQIRLTGLSQMSDFWSDPLCTSALHVCEQWRLWWDCADAQARLSHHWSPMW